MLTYHCRLKLEFFRCSDTYFLQLWRYDETIKNYSNYEDGRKLKTNILITKDQERCQYDHLPCPRLCLGQPQSYHGGLIYHHLVLLVLHWQLLSRMQDWDWKMHSWIKILMMKWFDSYFLPVANGVLLTQDCKECEELAYGLWIFLSSFVLCQLKRIKIYHKIKDEPKIDQSQF